MRRIALVIILLIFLIYLSASIIIPFLSADERTYIYSSKVTYINYGETQSLEPDLGIFWNFMNTSWQTAYLETTNDAYTLAKDSNGNHVIVFNLSPLPSGENLTISYSIRLEERKRGPPDVDFSVRGNLSDIPEALKQQYCTVEGSWLINENLRLLADTIWSSQEKTTNVLRIVTSLSNWIGSNIKSAIHDVPYYPNETYLSRKGDCDDKANLLITLCRALGIPAYLQVGCQWSLWSSETETNWGNHITDNLIGVSYHAWALVYIPPWGWLPFDLTLGWSPNDSLSVIKSARIWSIDMMPMLNITRSDWVGETRDMKTKVMASSIHHYNKDALIARDQETFLFWSFVAAILFVLIIIIVIKHLSRY